MLTFIKRLFQKEEVVAEKRLTLDELKQWLESKKDSIGNEMQASVDEKITGIRSFIAMMLEHLQKLEDASLQNPNIPKRAITIMEGNRTSFIKIMRRLFESVDLSYESFDELQRTCKEIQKDIDVQAKATSRSYQILSEFFAREVSDIAIHIKKIAQALKEMYAAVDASLLPKIKDCQGAILSIEHKMVSQKELRTNSKMVQKKLREHEDKITALEQQLRSVQESDAYAHYQTFQKEKDRLDEEIRILENKATHAFSGFDKALRKYEKVAMDHSEMIIAYQKNPLVALHTDTSFVILKILSSLQKMLEDNKLGLDDKKREKALTKIKNLDVGYFSKMRASYKKLREKRKSLEQAAATSEVPKKIEQLKEKIEHAVLRLRAVQQEYDTMQSDLHKIDVPKMKRSVQEMITSNFNERIILV